MLTLEITLPTPIGAAYSWLRAKKGSTHQQVLERAILLLIALESGEDNRCMDLVDHYGILSPEILEDLADNAERLANAFQREAQLMRMATGEIE